MLKETADLFNYLLENPSLGWKRDGSSYILTIVTQRNGSIKIRISDPPSYSTYWAPSEGFVSTLDSATAFPPPPNEKEAAIKYRAEKKLTEKIYKQAVETDLRILRLCLQDLAGKPSKLSDKVVKFEEEETTDPLDRKT